MIIHPQVSSSAALKGHLFPGKYGRGDDSSKAFEAHEYCTHFICPSQEGFQHHQLLEDGISLPSPLTIYLYLVGYKEFKRK